MADKISGDLALEYLRKYPTLPSRRVADLLFKEYPTEYRDYEHARTIVRYYRGSIGVKNRAKVLPDSLTPRVLIPPSDDKDYTPYSIPGDCVPAILAGDAHIPYHDQDALELMLERAIDIKAKLLILAGDWMDMYQASRFIRDPRLRNIKEEIDMFNVVLDEIQRVLPDTKIIFKYGNHEERYDNYLMTNAPELYQLETLHLKSVLGLDRRGIDVVKDKRVMKFGHLNIIHGHEYVFSISNPVNPARGLYNRAKKSTVCFHHHQTSEHTEPTISGEIVTCWSSGCLCNLRPDYMPLNKWNHGFVEVYGDDDGGFNVRNRRIINYKVV